jgi:hypothetical protein
MSNWAIVETLLKFSGVAALLCAAWQLVVGRKATRIAKEQELRFQITHNAQVRAELLNTLARSRAAAFYQRALSGALAWADRRFGPEGEPYALAWSLWLALAYSWCLFWGIWAAGGSSEVFGVDMLEASVPEGKRWPVALALTVGLGLLWLAMLWLGRRIGRWERGRVLRRRRKRQAVWKRRLPLALALGGGMMALALDAAGEDGVKAASVFGLLFLLSGGGLIAGLVSTRIRRVWLAVAGALAGAGAVIIGFLTTGLARKYRSGARRAIPSMAALGGILAWGLVALVALPEKKDVAVLASFFLFLPLANGGLDYVSWFVSRRLGRDLAERLKALPTRWRLAQTVAWHTVADLGVAVVLLLALAFVLGLGFGVAEHGRIVGDAAWRDLGLALTVQHAVRDPWGVQGGLWFSLMLVSTLVPTALHMLFLVASPVAAVQVGKSTAERRRLRAGLHPQIWQIQTEAERTELATQISRELVQRHIWVWAPAAALLVFVAGLLIAGIGAVFQLAWFAETVGSFACRGVDVADLAFDHTRAVPCAVWGIGAGAE